MPKPSRHSMRGTRRIDGLKVRVVDDPAAGEVDLDRMLRALARMMVRGHQHAGDHEAISPVSRSVSTLTVAPNPSPDDETNEAA